MSCTTLVGANPRISARRGAVVDLNVDFYKNGVLTDPYAIRHIEIYKTQVLPHNLVTTIPISELEDPLYPAPLCREYELADGTDSTAGATGASAVPGRYHFPYFAPIDLMAPDVYFDVWYYFAENPCDDDLSGTGTDFTSGPGTACDLNNPAFDTVLLKTCNRFWLYPEEWFASDRLQTIRFGFEPLDQRFYTPENRPLEVGLTPLPLYDYNYNLVTPMIPFLRPTISISTQRCELIVDNDPCRIGIRQGAFRDNPWVIQYDFDTSKFLKGTYQYQITLTLPDGSTRVSRKFILVVA
jgi:hypothetical protein